MNPLDVFLSEFKSHPSSRPASEENRRKWHFLLGLVFLLWEFCYWIPFSFKKTLFLPCQNILRSLSHFLSSSSVSLCISLLIISRRKPLMFSPSLNIFDMPKFPFESHIPAPALGSFITWLPDSSHLCICHWSKVVRGAECKKERSKIPRSFVWQRFKASYLISHNLPSVTNMFHYNLHLNGVKWRLFSWLPTPLPREHPFLPLSLHVTCTETQGRIQHPTPDGPVLTPCTKLLLCRHHC